MWFDVEERYKTIQETEGRDNSRLRFDVEERYKTIPRTDSPDGPELWFDVEERYKTIKLVGIELVSQDVKNQR